MGEYHHRLIECLEVQGAQRVNVRCCKNIQPCQVWTQTLEGLEVLVIPIVSLNNTTGEGNLAFILTCKKEIRLTFGRLRATGIHKEFHSLSIAGTTDIQRQPVGVLVWNVQDACYLSFPAKVGTDSGLQIERDVLHNRISALFPPELVLDGRLAHIRKINNGASLETWHIDLTQHCLLGQHREGNPRKRLLSQPCPLQPIRVHLPARRDVKDRRGQLSEILPDKLTP
mmetsp:Transcript_53372/g.147845  ORF Transcript_53372/g.147845 Transcript_53372/m.147845 type:complete len:227 (-) Transcript_53372:357-1037(-)